MITIDDIHEMRKVDALEALKMRIEYQKQRAKARKEDRKNYKNSSEREYKRRKKGIMGW